MYLKKITYNQIYNLCKIIYTSTINDISLLERKYNEHNVDFDNVYSVLTKLKILSKVDENIILSKQITYAIKDQNLFKEDLLYRILKANGDIRNELYEFLKNFIFEESIFRQEFNLITLIQFNSIRNILQELNFVLFDSRLRTCQINKKYEAEFLKFIEGRKTTIEEFKSNQIKIEILSYKAELNIIEFENKRLQILNEKIIIEHTSVINVKAGYDIKSYEDYLDNHNNLIERYIEVKAVSIEDFKFYWTRNEIEKAKMYNNSYFLYLLPVLGNSGFSIEQLKIIKNPYKQILDNSSDWTIEQESISCRL